MAKAASDFTLGIEYVIARLAMETLRSLPQPLAGTLAKLYTKLLDIAVPKLRRVARKNLSFALPQLSRHQHEQIIDGVFRSLARLILSFARFPDINASNVSEWIRYEGLEHYERAKAHGHGVLVATAHLGNWELSAFAHAILTEPMHVMVRPLDNPRVDNLVETRRQLSGNKMILKKESALSVVRALRQNEAVGVLIDQNTAVAEGTFIQFFGKTASANAAFAKLAARTRASVIPGFAFWEDAEQKYVLRFYPPIEMTGETADDTQRIHSFFEQLIRQYPDQWMWIHRRWKTRPDGEPPLY